MRRLLLFFFVVSISIHCIAIDRTRIIDLWKGTSNKAKGVTLTPFVASCNRFDGMAIVVCPGGSYCWLDYDVEGSEVAKWLNSNGISAFVLKYRVQGVFQFITHWRALFGGHQHPDMIEDIQRAIQYLRDNCSEYNINPDLIGAMGFSAGGHLVMSAACYSATNFISKYVDCDSVSLRPNFVVPIYPVVSMSHPDTHRRSRRALLGERGKSKQLMRDSLSLEKHIPYNCPPVFLINCKDDPIVKYNNSELLDSALTKAAVPHVYFQYNTGGHGFGASETLGTAECRQWKQEFLEWISKLSFYEQTKF